MDSTAFFSFGRTMRRVLTLALTLALMGLPLYALPENPDEHGQEGLTVDQILDRHYEAIGAERQRSVGSMKTSGRSVVMGMEAPYTRYSKRPNKILLEVYVQDMTGVQAFDGETAWWYMPFMGHAAPEAMPPDMAMTMIESAEFGGPLIDTEEKGHRVELLDVEKVRERDAYKLQVTMVTGGVQVHYVDAETFYIVRVESAAGDAVFLDHQIVGGFPVPQVIEMKGEMGEQIVYIDSVEFGVELDDAMFSMQ